MVEVTLVAEVEEVVDNEDYSITQPQLLKMGVTMMQMISNNLKDQLEGEM